jgi:hypothetical protein
VRDLWRYKENRFYPCVVERCRYTSGVIVRKQLGYFSVLKPQLRQYANNEERHYESMSTGISNSPDSRNWRQQYRAALFEIEESKLPARTAEAEKAVVLRAREFSGRRR